MIYTANYQNAIETKYLKVINIWLDGNDVAMMASLMSRIVIGNMMIIKKMGCGNVVAGWHIQCAVFFHLMFATKKNKHKITINYALYRNPIVHLQSS